MTIEGKLLDRITKLSCWKGRVSVEPLSGGITNMNFVVIDQGTKFFLRSGADIPVHGVMRFNELSAAQAAAEVGLSPRVIYHEPGIMVTGFIEGTTFDPEHVRKADNLVPIVDLIRRCHREMPEALRGPVLMFWPFQVVRSYAGVLRDGGSRNIPLLPELLSKAERLEEAVGPITVVFGHNDLLAANFIDDGARLWLIDWDYGGMNSPLFDLANLASNNEFSRDQELALVESYFGRATNGAELAAFRAMAAASLLRETMWSMVSELHSTLDFDYQAYTAENLDRFNRAYSEFLAEA